MDQTFRTAPAAQTRIEILDVLRGCAICVMLLVNIILMGRSVWEEFSLPFDGWTQADQVVYWVNFLFLEGAGRALFTILFGASFMLMMAKTLEPTSAIAPADLYHRRCLWMLLFGVLHATVLLWPGDILFHYAAPAMALLPFRTAKPRTLFVIAGTLLVILSLLRTLPDLSNSYLKVSAEQAMTKSKNGWKLTQAEQESITQWTDAVNSRKIDHRALATETQARKTYFSSVVFQTQTWVKWFDPQTPLWALEAFTFMVLGMALFKSGVLTGQLPSGFYIKLTLIAVPLALAINAHEAWVKWTFPGAPHVWWDDITYQAGRVSMALAYIGILINIFHTRSGAHLLEPLRTMGRMPLTNYLGQSLIAAILFTGFGLFGKFNNAQLWAVAVTILIGQYVFSRLWLEHYRMGPLEWVWRSLIYWQLQPLERPRIPKHIAPAH